MHEVEQRQVNGTLAGRSSDMLCGVSYCQAMCQASAERLCYRRGKSRQFALF